jgi:hypothetical protein
MIHPHTELRFISDAIGYGVFATRPIPRGTVGWTLCLFDRIFTPAEAATLPRAYQQVLAKYGYIDAAGDYVLCWDAGRYVNHGCEPAMLGVALNWKSRCATSSQAIISPASTAASISPTRCRAGAGHRAAVARCATLMPETS